jgi:hypothetical protein
VRSGLRPMALFALAMAAIALFLAFRPDAPHHPDRATATDSSPPVDDPFDVAAAPPGEPASAGDPADGGIETRPQRILYLHDIDDIKHEIYSREIESVDRLHLLDDLIQTGDMDTRELWDSDWSGVDDWKREANGFTLQRLDDDTLVFHPDPATMDLYSFFEELVPYEYDEETGEFVNEVDYYGKPIRNVLRFIKDDALVMMTISGDKVDLNIYDKNRDAE